MSSRLPSHLLSAPPNLHTQVQIIHVMHRPLTVPNLELIYDCAHHYSLVAKYSAKLKSVLKIYIVEYIKN